MNRVILAMLAVMVLLGALLRNSGLGNRRVDNDEAFAWRVAMKPSAEMFITAAGDTAPPAHYLLLKVWMRLWGSSAAALRGLSALCGVLLIAAVYGVVVQTGRWESGSIDEPSNAKHWEKQWHTRVTFGALTAALIAAVHSFQLEPNRTARMYGMGTFLAAFSAWLLLRALRASGRRPAWWVGYGITAALFLLTHHFAVFTLAAQAALGLWCAFARRAADLVDQRAARRGILLAAAVGLLLYGPWLPAALAQINRVSQAFWIQEQSALEWGQTFVRWCVGIDWANATLIVGCLFVAALAAVHALRLGYRSHHAPRDVALPGEMGKLKVDFPSRGARGPQADASSRPGAPGRGLRNAAAIALLAQATLPWVAIGLISTVGKHPMLQDRYLAFSHASWLALSGVTIASIRRIEWRIGLAALLVGTTLIGTDQFIRALPDGPPGIVASSERLARDYQPGGIVLVQDAPSLNCLRFYLSQIGANDVDVRAMLRPWPSPGHINHVASLGSWEFLDRVENLRYDVPQLWFAGTPNKLPGGGNLPGWQWMEEITYKGHGPQAPDYILRRYERPSAGKPKPVSAE